MAEQLVHQAGTPPCAPRCSISCCHWLFFICSAICVAVWWPQPGPLTDVTLAPCLRRTLPTSARPWYAACCSGVTSHGPWQRDSMSGFVSCSSSSCTIATCPLRAAPLRAEWWSFEKPPCRSVSGGAPRLKRSRTLWRLPSHAACASSDASCGALGVAFSFTRSGSSWSSLIFFHPDVGGAAVVCGL